VRRGICRSCKKTFTILPDWLAPVAHYSLHCRKQACERIAVSDLRCSALKSRLTSTPSLKLEIREAQSIMMNRKTSYWLLGAAAALAPLVILAASGRGR
jgi:hypothetical protein